MMTMQIQDGYGSAVNITILPHEQEAILDVTHDKDMQDFYLDSTGLRDLARLASIAADELDRAKDAA